MDEARTRALLSEIAADPEPPEPVDLDRIMAAGRRPRHRAAAWVAAAAVVVLVIGVVTLVVRPDTGPPVPVTSASATPSPVTPPSEITPPTRFDPRRLRITPGWLPDGFVTGEYGAGRTGESFAAWRATSTGSAYRDQTTGLLEVYLGVRGAAPHHFGERYAAPAAGPSINGAPSTWEPGHGGGLLRWEWAPGAPATIRIMDVAGARAIAIRFATTLELGSTRPAALPFTTETPPGLTVAGASFVASRYPPQQGLRFAGDADPTDDVSITLISSPGSKGGFENNATVNGRPTQLFADRVKTSILQRYGNDLLEVVCYVRKGQSAAEARTACVRVVETTRVVGVTTDPSTWATTPVRPG
ncbi:hypothetical protein [Cryptosporangium japonicum]|uniref:Uncharacterized protein n=1 Tax=Cryptosporangium japonicum TaxID=80872 RepID=A0ABN0U1A6_9ACTN